MDIHRFLDDNETGYRQDLGQESTALLESLGLLVTRQEVLSRIDPCKRLVLYGCGAGGGGAVRHLTAKGIRPAVICDTYSTAKSAYGFEVVKPQWLVEHKHEIQILITTFHYKEVIDMLLQMGLAKLAIGIFAELSQFESYQSGRLNSDIDKIRQAFALLNDQESKQVFINLLRYKLDGNPIHYLRTSDLHSGYDPIDKIPAHTFTSEVLTLSEDEVLADCGANDGDTIRQFIALTKGKFKQIVGFEPDRNSLVSFRKWLDAQHDARISIEPFGVYKERATLGFVENNKGSMISSSETANTIEVIDLDHYLDRGFTLIKMNIEGAELDALHGAEQMIKKLRPKLIIYAYHDTTHLWELLLYIASLLGQEKARFFLRHDGYSHTETLLYVLPQ
ncbi:hypothetical protein AGMMS50229_06060 [Campylobacterota bacterium]|nr:hypothetical protein AGMMS50229_06060 [Campylobacterota bacterium]